MTGWRAGVLAAGLLVAVAARAQEQTPNAPAPAGQPQQPSTTKPANGDAFPFPDATPKKADAKDFPFPDNAATPASLPANPAAPTAASPPAADKSATPAAPAGNFSSSLTLHDEGSSGEPPAANPARATEDARVGKLYWNLGNYEGAYLRYRDAVQYSSQDAALWFGLAEAERGLGRYMKARVDYQKVIDLAPQSKDGREAEKILRKLPTKNKPQPQGPGPKLP